MSDLFGLGDLNDDIDKNLQEYFADKTSQAKLMDEAYVQLWQVISDVATVAGKKIRPKLFSFAYKAYSQNGLSNTVLAKVANSWELLHIALLMHDDIMDKAQFRHGVPNVDGKYRELLSSRGLEQQTIADISLSAALSAGDLLLTGSKALVETSELGDKQKQIICKYLNLAIDYVACGQLLDILSPITHPSQAQPEKVINMKTSGYTMIYPMQAGAELAGADEDELEKLSQLGDLLGRIFQLTDDLLGSFGDEAVTGKSTESDIRDGQRTVMFIHAYSNCREGEKEIFEQVGIGKNPSAETIDKIKQIMISSGAKAEVERQVAVSLDSAVEIIESLDISPEHKSVLKTFGAKLKLRDK